MTHQYKVNDKKHQGKRLDIFLSENLVELSRSKIKYLIKNGKVLVNGEIEDPDYKISLNDKIKIEIEKSKETYLEGEKIPLDIVFEDEDLIVINKPAGLVMHPGAGNKSGTLVNAIINHCGKELSFIGDNKRPGIVHRIDKNTSGLVVIAKNDFTLNHLSNQFSKHSIERLYTAICWGQMQPHKGKIQSFIKRSEMNRKKMSSSSSKGKKAITNYETKEILIHESIAVASVLECKLETGRTHQIRVHLSEHGCPLIGDNVYGRSPRKKVSSLSKISKECIEQLPGQALHAKTLGFVHPREEKNVIFQSLMPDYLRNLINSFKTSH